jgi:hypothetical protein
MQCSTKSVTSRTSENKHKQDGSDKKTTKNTFIEDKQKLKCTTKGNCK